MKLRLPKQLIAELIAAGAFVAAAGSAAYATDFNTGAIWVTAGHVEYVSSNDTTTKTTTDRTSDTTFLYYLMPEDDGMNFTFDSISLKAADTLIVAMNEWSASHGGTDRWFDTVTINELNFAGNGGNLQIDEGNGAVVSSVVGTLSSVTNAGRLALGGQIALGSSIVNTGSLTISNATFAVNSLDQFETVGETSFSDGANGYITADFRLASGGTIIADNTKVSLNGAEATGTTIDTEGNVLFHATDNSVYYINENAAETLLNATGDGTLKLTTNAVLSSTNAAVPAATSATGTLIVGNGSGTMVKLVIGRAETPGGEYVNNYANIKSFSNVTLDNGELWFQANTYEEAAIHNLTVTEHGGKLSIWDTQSKTAPALLLGGTTTLDGTLTLATTWRNKVTFEAMTGSGTLLVNDSSEAQTVTVNAISDTLGAIDFRNGNGTLNLSTGGGKLSTLAAGKGTLNLLDGTKIGQLNGGSANNNRSASITIASGATVAIDTVNIAWGFNSFTVDGELDCVTNFRLATSSNYGVSGEGTINTAKLDLANWGAYTLAVKRINIGSGGITGNNNAARTLSGTTIGASANWSSAINFKLADTVTFDTNGHDITMSGSLGNASDAVGSLVKTGAGTLTLSGELSYTGATTVESGTLKIVNKTAAKVHELGNVTLGAGTTLLSYFENWSGQIADTDYSDVKTTMGMLSMTGTAATVESTHFGGLTTIKGITGNGTLTLKNSHYANVTTTFAIGGAATTSEQTTFHGTLDVQHTNVGDNGRTTIVMFNDEFSAADAVLNMSATAASGKTRILGIGLSSDTVKLKGIHDASVGATAAGSQYQIFSGDVAHLPAQYKNTYFNDASDGTKRTLELTGDGSYSTAAKVGANINIKMSGTGTQTFSGDMSDFNGDIDAEKGNLVLKNLGSAASFELNNLTVKDGATVSGYTGAAIDAAQEATISVAGTLTAESGATLNANLIVKDGATINVSGENGLTMGSTVTFEQGSKKLNIGNDIVDGLNSLSASLAFGGSVTLFSGVDAFTIGDSAYNADTTYHASDYFNLAGVNRPWDFVIKYETPAGSTDGGTVSLYMETPEPATATLSLLALASLAARRKRK